MPKTKLRGKMRREYEKQNTYFKHQHNFINCLFSIRNFQHISQLPKLLFSTFDTKTCKKPKIVIRWPATILIHFSQPYFSHVCLFHPRYHEWRPIALSSMIFLFCLEANLRLFHKILWCRCTLFLWKFSHLEVFCRRAPIFLLNWNTMQLYWVLLSVFWHQGHSHRSSLNFRWNFFGQAWESEKVDWEIMANNAKQAPQPEFMLIFRGTMATCFIISTTAFLKNIETSTKNGTVGICEHNSLRQRN